MLIDWSLFTPLSAVGGGVLIGVAASLLALVNGRIAGISGIVWGLLHRLRKEDIAWRIVFLAGLLVAPAGYSIFKQRPEITIKVLNFLDLAGQWDPSLALVMAGAITTGVAPFFFAQRRTRTILGTPMRLANVKHMDRRCVLGSLTFGVGRGLAGFCPGPAIVTLATGELKVLVFSSSRCSEG